MLDTNISVLLTTKCTLNCKYCSSGVPYYALPAHISSRRLLRQTERLLQIYQKAGIRVSHLDLIGGEPLLHPEIALIVRNLREQRPLFHELRILTNGSVWPPPPGQALLNEIEAFWSERFLMILSDYGKLSPKLNEMRAALDARGIRYRIDRYEGPQQYYGGWVSYGEDGILQGTALQRYQECAFCHSGVSEMFDGMAFPCVRALALHATERAALSADEWINVEDDLTENAEKLRALYERTLPFSVCDACTGLGRNALRYPAAEQLKRAAPSS